MAAAVSTFGDSWHLGHLYRCRSHGHLLQGRSRFILMWMLPFMHIWYLNLPLPQPGRLPSEIERLPSELDISLMHRLPSLDAVGSSSVKVSVKGEHVGSRRSSQIAKGQGDEISPQAKVNLWQTLERTTNRCVLVPSLHKCKTHQVFKSRRHKR